MAELEADQDLLNKQSMATAEETGGADLLLCRPSSLVPVITGLVTPKQWLQ